jgi:hypothetical protein
MRSTLSTIQKNDPTNGDSMEFDRGEAEFYYEGLDTPTRPITDVGHDKDWSALERIIKVWMTRKCKGIRVNLKIYYTQKTTPAPENVQPQLPTLPIPPQPPRQRV